MYINFTIKLFQPTMVFKKMYEIYLTKNVLLKKGFLSKSLFYPSSITLIPVLPVDNDCLPAAEQAGEEAEWRQEVPG